MSEKDLVLGERLGVGTFGATSKATFRGETVAAKVMHQAVHKKYTGNQNKEALKKEEEEGSREH